MTTLSMTPAQRNAHREFGWLADIASLITAVVAIIGVIVAYQQLNGLSRQLEQANQHKQWENFNALNQRYADLYEKFEQTSVKSGKHQNAADETPRKRRLARQYFNLCSEEYWLHEKKMLPPDMWEKRIMPGIVLNLKQYPTLASDYQYWHEQGAFSDPPEFHSKIDQLITESQKKP